MNEIQTKRYTRRVYHETHKEYTYRPITFELAHGKTIVVIDGQAREYNLLNVPSPLNKVTINNTFFKDLKIIQIIPIR